MVTSPLFRCNGIRSPYDKLVSFDTTSVLVPIRLTREIPVSVCNDCLISLDEIWGLLFLIAGILLLIFWLIISLINKKAKLDQVIDKPTKENSSGREARYDSIIAMIDKLQKTGGAVGAEFNDSVGQSNKITITIPTQGQG